jgi:hypothetical protein
VTNPPEGTIWDVLRQRVPTVASELEALQRVREKQLAAYARGARFRGTEQLLRYLDAAVVEYDNGPELLRSARPLVERSRADFIIALDATLAGQLSVAMDAMRDILEIEMLLLDFVAEPSHLSRWLSTSDRDRRRFFAPAAVRRRLAKEGVGEVTSSVFGVDYAAHSAALHVNPAGLPLGGKKPVTDAEALDAGFWEIFEHARRLLLAIEGLRARAYEGAERDRLALLDDFWDAWARAIEMQEIYIALMEAPVVLGRELGRVPTTVEVLEFTKQRLIERSPRSPEWGAAIAPSQKTGPDRRGGPSTDDSDTGNSESA